MSRRITLLLLTASVVTLAQPASADSECFDQSCRMPGVSEPPAPVETPIASETTGVVDVVPPAM